MNCLLTVVLDGRDPPDALGDIHAQRVSADMEMIYSSGPAPAGDHELSPLYPRNALSLRDLCSDGIIVDTGVAVESDVFVEDRDQPPPGALDLGDLCLDGFVVDHSENTNAHGPREGTAGVSSNGTFSAFLQLGDLLGRHPQAVSGRPVDSHSPNNDTGLPEYFEFWEHNEPEPVPVPRVVKPSTIVKRAVRSFMKTLDLRRANSTHVRKFNKHGKRKYAPSEEGQLFIDMDNNMGSRYNKRCKDIILQRFRASPTNIPANTPPTMIIKAIQTFYKHLKDYHIDNPAPRMMQTTLLRRRRRGLAYYKRDASAAKALELLNQIPYSAMSDDEADRNSSEFLVKTPIWRSRDPRVTKLFTFPDHLYISWRFQPNSEHTRSSGQLPRVRRDKGHIAFDGEVPVGLPMNLYDSDWLKGQPQLYKDHLAVQKPIDLDDYVFSPYIHQVVNTAKTGAAGRRVPARKTNM
ncbi:hypothetical protein BDZ89DRAFT_1152062 [Hymenopellis radicata]|nr:hypothetical protein BDZ89DRAFT_1152062 [Hymenopellis radicata]